MQVIQLSDIKKVGAAALSIFTSHIIPVDNISPKCVNYLPTLFENLHSNNTDFYILALEKCSWDDLDELLGPLHFSVPNIIGVGQG